MLQFIKKLNTHLQYFTDIPLPGIYSREIKAYVYSKTCKQIFRRSLFVIAKTRNNPNVHKMVNGQIVTYTHTHILDYDSVIKRTINTHNMDTSEMVTPNAKSQI